MVSKERLQELKTILLEDYGIVLTDVEVAELGNTLVSLFQILSEQEVSDRG